MTATAVLTPLQMEVLEFERLRFKFLGTKESAIRERFRWSLTQYTATLNATIDHPAAQVYDPQLVARLHRLREARAAQRSPSRLQAGAR